MGAQSVSLAARCVAEVLGTFILVFFGLGAVHAAVLTGAQSGLWQVAIVWGVAVMLAVYVVGDISGAHINPAITVALALWGHFPGRLVVPYVVSQVAGAFVAGMALFVLFGPFLDALERDRHVVRGQPDSVITAMCYGEYYPNPGLDATKNDPNGEKSYALVTEPVAFVAETLGTLLLALVVFALADERNRAAPASRLAPVFIGLTVAVLISVIAPLTQACFNPARDVGPRLWAYCAGWGRVAIPGPRGFFATVYVVAPTLGAILGGGLYLGLLRPALAVRPPEGSMERL
jgi:glycerol uptake facilitator protein